MKNKAIILLIILLVAAAGIIIYLANRPAEVIEMEPNVVALEDTGEDAPAEGIQIPGYPNLTVTDNVIQNVFANPTGNPCYFEIAITLTDTGETVYQSQKFSPGTGIQNPQLTTTLAPGTYDAQITYTTTSLEDQSPMNGAVVNTVLTVQ